MMDDFAMSVLGCVCFVLLSLCSCSLCISGIIAFSPRAVVLNLSLCQAEDYLGVKYREVEYTKKVREFNASC